MHKIIEPLSSVAFRAFGDIISVTDATQHHPINHGHSERYHDLAELELTANNGRAAVSIFRSTPLPLPLTITQLERHPLSSQAFVPLGSEPYLLVVAPAGELDETAIRVFLAQPDQGVNYHAGTWHHFNLALNATSDFLVIDRVGESPNCDEQALNTPFTLSSAEIFP